MKKQITLLVAVCAAIFTTTNASAQLVTSGLDDGSDGTLRKEVMDTPAGGTITFSGVTTITLTSEILIDKSLIINGSSSTPITIDANNTSRIFNITAGPFTLNNLILINGVADNGGALYITNAIVGINECLLQNNTANGASGSGGAIFNGAGGLLVVLDSEISSNVANRAGGGIEDQSAAGVGVTLTNVILNDNNAGVAPATAAPGNGGGFHITGSGSAIITGGTVNGNVAASEGGGLWNGIGIMTVDATTIDGNTASGAGADNGGGGIYALNGGTVNLVNGATVSNNIANGTAGSGGGILVDADASFSAADSFITGNRANRAGGGIELVAGTGSTTLTNTALDDNNAGVSPAVAAPGSGGGLHITGMQNITITGGTTNDNIAANEGGGLWNGSGLMTVIDHTVDGNTASGNDAMVAGAAGGGGIYNEGGTVDLSGTTMITNNVADGAQSTGGGILNAAGTLTANGITIMDNTSNRAGGGIETNGGGAVTLTDVTLNSNDTGVVTGTGAPGNGGGLHVSGNGPVTVTGGTTNDNTAANEGGGLWNGSGLMTVVDHTVDGNTASGNDAMVAGAAGGGGIYNEGGTLDLSGSTMIINNVADGAQSTGGGILNAAGTLTANGITIMDNTSNRAGGGIETNGGGAVTLTDVSLDSNDTGVVTGTGAPGNGGGLHVSGNSTINVTGGTVNMNTAASEGGGLWNGTGTLTVDATTIDGNTASGASADNGGGGIYALNGGTVNLVNGATVSNNIANGTSGSGGGILVDVDASFSAADSFITGNRANRAGGGIELVAGTGTTTLTNTALDDNNAGVSPAVAAPGSGGGLHITGMQNITITGGTTNDNIAANEGGGLWNGSGLMTVIDHTVDGNTASGNDAMVAGAAGGGGIYNEGGTVDLSGTTMITNNVADGAQSTGGGILNAAGTLTANGITIMDNTSNRAGGGIETNGGGAVTLTDVTLNSNDTGVVTGTGAPGNGGGLHVSGNSTISVTGGTVNMNTAASEGGGLWNGTGTMTVDATTIDGNTASGAGADNGGGGIYALNGGTVSLVNGATVSNNIANGTAGSGGGILVDADASFSAADSFITGNRANRAGGGIEVVAGAGTSSLTNTALNNNNAGVSPAVAAPGNGGGLHISGAQDFAITGGTVNGNSAGREGGGLWNGTGVMTVDGVLIDANTAIGAAANQGGAGIFNNGGTLNVVNGTVVSNNLSTGASASGGGLLSTTGAVTVSNSTFDSNSANRAGGAIELIDGTLDFNNSVMSNNDVNGTAGTPAPGNGGGFHVTGTTGTISFVASTITGNSAANEGGGLWNQNGTTMNVSNSTIDSNSSDEGAGIYNNTGSITTVMTSTISGNTATTSGGGLTNNGASLDLNAVTVAQNSAATGGGIDAVNSVSLKNTIVALNTAASGTDVSGTIASNDYNLIGADDLNVFTPQANDLEGVDPMAGPLQDNGGSTLTHQLLTGSPAYDAGAPGDNFDDQIGQAIFGASRDIGAYESQVVLSISEFNALSDVKIFPNPTKGQFNISIGDNVSGSIEVQIVSITGRLVQKVNIGNGVNNLDITGMSTGMYIINISTESGSASHKLILD